MEFSEKLMTLRKQAGLSQEQLADRLGVTRQSVSKWESGAVLPEIVKLISLSEMFGVSVDYLVKDYMDEPEHTTDQKPDTARIERKLDALASDYHRSWGPYYHYTSKTRVFGLPLVSVRFGRDRHPSRNSLAVGIIAIGNFSVGIISLGLISAGVFSIGMISLGLMALGMVSVGYLAIGLSAVGVYAAGVAVNGLKIAVGVAASGETAVGRDAAGTNVLLLGDGLSRGTVETFLQTHHPNLWRPLLRLFSSLGANIK
ncbi:helix-turn-helix domain-containing protein [Dysosmobacter sp.]|uniref:helix-turn-helix domain-containing protein n=1 Tax=Dysosmobacter sp. TaxID=2591382 RepID=UPI002A9C008D|nr:helix-turn-helix transcriptional regulator [Dysosmobacter sp.]MDY5612842.1 helix-turn-helix transcriptional regulator [Dysosmobacter sp.]